MKATVFGKFIAGLAVALVLAGCAGTSKQESTGDYVDDTVVTARVKTALLQDPVVSGLAVNVETFKGVVQLSGFVKTQAEKNKAHHIAHDTKGVVKVVDNILVR